MVLTPLAISALAASLFAPPCSCIPGPPISSYATAAAARDAASAVFVGVVQTIENVPVSNVVDSVSGRVWRSTDALATVRVMRTWKGALDRTVIVRTAAAASMCGTTLTKGRTLLVFGVPRAPDVASVVTAVQPGDTVFTSSCTPTTGLTSQIARISELLGRPGSDR